MGTYIPIPKPLLNRPNGRPDSSTDRLGRLHKNSKVTNRVLYIIGVAGQIALDMLFPKILPVNEDQNRNKKNYLKKKLVNLEMRGLIKIVKGSLALTNEGREQYVRLLSKEKKSMKRKWDGKWRLVMFDIWERRKRLRNLLRLELKEYGFKKLQHSVWAYPHDCESFVNLLKADINVGRGIIFLVVEKLEDDGRLRSMFKI